MALNTNPIYSGVGQIESTATYGTNFMNAANTALDANAANAYIIISGSASGSFVQRVRFKASGSTSTTVARIFINNGGPTGSGTNNFLFDEITLPATTAAGNATAATAVYEVPLNIALPPGYRLLATLGVAQSTTGGWNATAIAGSYVTP
jgi:hypothetical protein